MKYNVISISLDSGTSEKLVARLMELGMTRSEYVRSLLRKDIGKSTATPPRKAKKNRSRKGDAV